MKYYIATDRFGNYDLVHHGIKGQRWGVRRFQNEDGTWTEAGKKRYGNGSESFSNAKQNYKQARKQYSKDFNSAYNYDRFHLGLTKKVRDEKKARWDKAADSAEAFKSAKKEYKKEKIASRANKKIEGYSKASDSIMAKRQQHEAKLSERYQRKIDKGRITKEQADSKLSDYREGSPLVKAGYDKCQSIIHDYKNARIKAIDDPSFKKTPEYKAAARGYRMLRYLESNSWESKDYAALYYAFDEAKKNGK